MVIHTAGRVGLLTPRVVLTLSPTLGFYLVVDPCLGIRLEGLPAPLVSQVLKEFMDDDVKKLLRKITINSWIK